jgi:hypothetical protein
MRDGGVYSTTLKKAIVFRDTMVVIKQSGGITLPRYGGVKAFLDADPRRAPCIRTVHEEVANFAPVIGRYYPDRPYAELVRVVLAVSAIIRGSAAAIPILESGESHAAFVDDIALANEQFIRARLGRPTEPRVSRPLSRSTKRTEDLRAMSARDPF